MKALSRWLLLGVLLAALVIVTTPVTTAQGAVTLQVFDPTGAIEVTQLHAPRLADLSGTTICEVSDAMWQGDRTFPVIRELLLKQFPTAKVIPYTEFPQGEKDMDSDNLVKIAKQKGCQAAIVGNAG